MRTQPSVGVGPNHSAQRWQRLENRLPLYYFAFWSARPSRGRKLWRVFALCLGNSIAITRTLRWIATPGWWQLSPGSRDVSLPRQWWPQQGPGRWWWPWQTCNEPSLWADWRWQGLSRNCLPFNPSKLVNQWQNLSINPASSGWAPGKILSPHKACGGLPSRLSIYCISSHSLWRHGRTLASSIFGLRAHVLSWYQSGLLAGRRDACWWAPSRWFPGCRGGFGGIAHCQYTPSPAS